MNSKTLQLFDHYTRTLLEQDEVPQDPAMGGEQPQDVQDVVDPVPEVTMPLTSEGEEQYISDLIDASLYKPSPEEASTLTNLQSVMKMKRFKNAREEILPTILSIIAASSGEGSLKQELQNID
jgi:hypothetical protein|tara:strand:+ start:1835 stop:2203 length:369 start_codon:yes stop_codon:yes gene_type:complete